MRVAPAQIEITIHSKEQSGLVDLAVLREWTSRIKYKPGTIFDWQGEVFGGSYRLTISMPVIDVRDMKTKTPVQLSHVYNDYEIERWDFKAFQAAIYNQLKEIEMHELQEFYQVDGWHFIDPHPEMRRVASRMQPQTIPRGTPIYYNEAYGSYYATLYGAASWQSVNWNLIVSPE